jgi:hypothetical protein
MSRYRLLDLSAFPDCNALSDNWKCTRLTVSKCQGQECSFKRTSKEDFESIQCAYRRLFSLDSSKQSHIAKKYYRGSMPWVEEESAKMYRENKGLKSLIQEI